MKTVCTRNDKDDSIEFNKIAAGECVWSNIQGLCIKTTTGDSIVNLSTGNLLKVGYLDRFYVVDAEVKWLMPVKQ